jgi:hypothetical protein
MSYLTNPYMVSPLAQFWDSSVGTWINVDGQTSKTGTAGYQSYNATVASSSPQTAIISILDFDAYYFNMFDSPAYLASSGGQSPPISYDERACEYGFLTRTIPSSHHDGQIVALKNAVNIGNYNGTQLTTSSKVKMEITSSLFTITYSILGDWSDTATLDGTPVSVDTDIARMLVTNNNMGTAVTDNSVTAEFV